MTKKELEQKVKEFEKHGQTAEQLNAIRSEIFNALDAGDIQARTKDKLLKDLYFAASVKGIFFMRVMERNTDHLPKNEEEAKRLEEEKEDEEYEEDYEESYEESYSYSDEEDDEEGDEEEVVGS